MALGAATLGGVFDGLLARAPLCGRAMREAGCQKALLRLTRPRRAPSPRATAAGPARPAHGHSVRRRRAPVRLVLLRGHGAHPLAPPERAPPDARARGRLRGGDGGQQRVCFPRHPLLQGARNASPPPRLPLPPCLDTNPARPLLSPPSLLAQWLNGLLRAGNVFFLYAALCATAAAFTAVLLPETKGHTLEEIEGIFAGDGVEQGDGGPAGGGGGKGGGVGGRRSAARGGLEEPSTGGSGGDAGGGGGEKR